MGSQADGTRLYGELHVSSPDLLDGENSVVVAAGDLPGLVLDGLLEFSLNRFTV